MKSVTILKVYVALSSLGIRNFVMLKLITAVHQKRERKDP